MKTKTASNRTLRKGMMKKKMDCSKNSEETSSDSELHVLNNHRRDGYHASFVCILSRLSFALVFLCSYIYKQISCMCKY